MHTPFIWAIALVPLAWTVALVQWDLESFALRSLAAPFMLDRSYLLAEALSLAMLLALAVLAYLDWRQLGREGHPHPFHWAWVLLGPAGYIVGRSMLVKRLAGRGYAPVWVFTATFAVAIWVLVDKVSSALPAVLNAIWPIP